VTVLEVIAKSADFLAKRGVESPRLHTELLLAHVLQLPRMKLYLNFERQLTEPELDSLRQLVQRRGQRQPLQHIVGSTSFCGLEIRVNPHVLIPRPETELLAEAGWQFLTSFDSQPTAALDFGTGSGCIAIALASKCPNTRVVAVDISAEALETARLNARENGVADRVVFRLGSAFTALNPGEKFDLLISNPPYIPSAEIATLAPEVRDHDPRLALDGGADGLDFYRRLAQEAAQFLQPHGKLMVEFGAGQADAVTAMLVGQHWKVESVQSDYSQQLRLLTAARVDATI
jgi:release factor glutamine methyltransferase